MNRRRRNNTQEGTNRCRLLCESVSFFPSPLFPHLVPSTRAFASSCRGWKPFNLSFLSLSPFPPSLFHFSRVARCRRFARTENQHTDRERGWCRARHDSRYKEITRGPERLCVHKSRRIALSRWLPPYRRRNDTPGDRRRMRRKGSGRERLARAMQGAKGWRASERGCFSTTSCSRHPQTPLDPDATPKEKERERGREVEKVERRLADHKSPKLVSNRPLCSFLSSTFWPLRPGYTHTCVRAFYGYTRYGRVAYT